MAEIKKFKSKEHFNRWLINAKSNVIYNKGIKNIPGFDYEKGLDALIKKSRDIRYIYWAGIHWKEFDYNKGLDKLIKKDKTGYWVYYAGMDWEEFNYNKGLDELIKKDETGRWIYNAGMDWKQFNYNKGLDELKKLVHKYYYNRALKDWPKGIELSKEITKEIRKTAIKDPNRKKFKLKEGKISLLEILNSPKAKKMYRELSKKYHPDRKDGNDKIMVKVNKAKDDGDLAMKNLYNQLNIKKPTHQKTYSDFPKNELKDLFHLQSKWADELKDSFHGLVSIIVVEREGNAINTTISLSIPFKGRIFLANTEKYKTKQEFQIILKKKISQHL